MDRLIAYTGAVLYRLARPLIFRQSAQQAHEHMMRLLAWADDLPRLPALKPPERPVTVGGVTLAYPVILAAGLVKGHGFADEAEAVAAVRAGQNIIPGWRSVPRVAGLVEFGSFTRRPRLGNPGVVVWRDVPARSTQNRVGLRNPGAMAAAAFLGKHQHALPAQFGVNIAISPGVDDPQQAAREVVESLRAFIGHAVQASWFTLNISCPNTEDDPEGRQTEAQTRAVCGAAADYLRAVGSAPLWVKLGPSLSDEQYAILMRVFDAVGVRAVVATNTMPAPAPDAPQLTAGVGGRRLHVRAVTVAAKLVQLARQQGSAVDVVGCGGVNSQETRADFSRVGAKAVQYWSALIYQGPFIGWRI